MTIRRLAAVACLTGGILLAAGVYLAFGVGAGLIAAGVLLIAAGVSSL